MALVIKVKGKRPECVGPDDLVPVIPAPGGPNYCPDGPDEDCEELRKAGMAM